MDRSASVKLFVFIQLVVFFFILVSSTSLTYSLAVWIRLYGCIIDQ